MLETDYRAWISRTETSTKELAAMGRQAAGLGYSPRISLLLVIDDADEVWIKSSVDSISRQVYPHLEICICDNGSERQHVGNVLEDYAATDERIRLSRLLEKESWAGAHNVAFAMATGEFVALLEQGDELAPEGLFKVVEFLQSVSADVVYTDEDQIDVSGRRFDPVFKPYWSPDLLLSTAYIGRLCVMRRDILETLEMFREDRAGAEEHDLTLRLSEKSDRIFHLPEVVYHRRRLHGPGESRSQATSLAIEDALSRRGEDATVEPANGSCRVIRRVGGTPEVSVVVHAPEVWTDWSLVDRLVCETAYPIRRIAEARLDRTGNTAAARMSHPLPARTLNLAASEGGGEYLAFIDARARIADSNWLAEMLGHAQRQGVGAVGCKVLDPSGGLRHGGSLVDTSRLTGDPREGVTESNDYLPLTDRPFNFGATSAECMMVRRATFEEAGGFDDTNLPNAFYDLDLSFRFRENGLLNVYTPYTDVVCKGSHRLPYIEEIEYMWHRWWEMVVQVLHYRLSPPHPAHHEFDKRALLLLPL